MVSLKVLKLAHQAFGTLMTLNFMICWAVPIAGMGQLYKLIRADYLVDAVGLNHVKGRPFKASDIVDKVKEIIG